MSCHLFHAWITGGAYHRPHADYAQYVHDEGEVEVPSVWTVEGVGPNLRGRCRSPMIRMSGFSLNAKEAVPA